MVSCVDLCRRLIVSAPRGEDGGERSDWAVAAEAPTSPWIVGLSVREIVNVITLKSDPEICQRLLIFIF